MPRCLAAVDVQRLAGDERGLLEIENSTYDIGDLAHATAFGHFGASGTIAWADPEEDLAVVLLTNRAWASRWPVQESRLARLANAIMAALD